MSRREHMIDDLRAADESVDGSLSVSKYESYDGAFTYPQIRDEFGSWNAAKEAIGFDTSSFEQRQTNQTSPVPDDIDMTQEEWEDLSPFQRHYRKNKEYHKERKNRRRRELREWVNQQKDECARCDEDRSYVLVFHHEDPEKKSASIPDMIQNGHSKESIREEMDKCIILCANCHRAHHHS